MASPTTGSNVRSGDFLSSDFTFADLSGMNGATLDSSNLDAFQEMPDNFNAFELFDLNPEDFTEQSLNELFESSKKESLGVPSGSAQAMEFPVQQFSRNNELEDSAAFSSKRTRSEATPDTLSACWTSPLCPHNTNGDKPPDPSTCDGGCAAFLFPSAADAIDPSDITLPSAPKPRNFANIDAPGKSQARSGSKRAEGSSLAELMPSRSDTSRTSSLRVQPARIVKVKIESEEEEEEEEATAVGGPHKTTETTLEAPVLQSATTRPRGRVPHNQVERKYRESLNTQLEGLRRAVPALCQPPKSRAGDKFTQLPCLSDGADIEDLPTLAVGSKPSKAMILSGAVGYIKQLERELEEAQKTSERLRERLRLMSQFVGVGTKAGGKCGDCEILGWVKDLNIGGTESRL